MTKKKRAALAKARTAAAAARAAQTIAKKAAVIANQHSASAVRAATVSAQAAAIAASSVSPVAVRKAVVRRIAPLRKRMAKAVLFSPGQTPVRAVRHKHLDKYKRRIFVGPRGAKFAMRPSGGKTYKYQEHKRQVPVYGVYKKSQAGAVKMLKKFIGAFTTKRRAAA